MDEVKGRVLAACCLDELLGDTSVSERFVYIKVIHPSDGFVLFHGDHLHRSPIVRVGPCFSHDSRKLLSW